MTQSANDNNMSRTLRAIGACSSSWQFVRGKRSQQQAWDECERGEWMIWLLARIADYDVPENNTKLVGCLRDVFKMYPKSARTRGSFERMMDGLRRWLANPCVETRVPSYVLEEGLGDWHGDYMARLCNDPVDYLTRVGDHVNTAIEISILAEDVAEEAAFAWAETHPGNSCVCLDVYDDEFQPIYDRFNKKIANIVRRHFPKAPRIDLLKLKRRQRKATGGGSR